MKSLLLIPACLLCACSTTQPLDQNGNPVPKPPSAWSSTAFRFEFGFKGVSVGVTIPERAQPERAVYPIVTGKSPVPAE